MTGEALIHLISQGGALGALVVMVHYALRRLDGHMSQMESYAKAEAIAATERGAKLAELSKDIAELCTRIDQLLSWRRDLDDEKKPYSGSARSP